MRIGPTHIIVEQHYSSDVTLHSLDRRCCNWRKLNIFTRIIWRDIGIGALFAVLLNTITVKLISCFKACLTHQNGIHINIFIWLKKKVSTKLSSNYAVSVFTNNKSENNFFKKSNKNVDMIFWCVRQALKHEISEAKAKSCLNFHPEVRRKNSPAGESRNGSRKKLQKLVHLN